MSFGSPLKFNISKSIPTTSTTNANSSSLSLDPASTIVDNNGSTTATSAQNSTANSVFLQNILSINSSKSDKSLPLGSLNSLQGAGVAPSLTTVHELVKLSSDTSDKRDLLDLFDKFDVNSTVPDTRSESMVSNEKTSLDEKYHEDHSYDENTNSEMVELRNAHVTKLPLQSEQLNLEDNQDVEERNFVETETLDIPFNVDDELASNQPQDTQEESELKPELSQEEHETEPETNVVENQDVEVVENETADENKDLSDIVDDNENSGNVEFFASTPSESTETEEGNTQKVVQPSEDKTISTDQHQLSHKPFDFQIFLSQLRRKSADPIVRYIRSFLVSLTRQGHTFTAEQRIKIIVEFKGFMNEKFSMFEPFASMDETDLENSREGLEKLIMNRLYDQCFPPEVAKQNIGYIPEAYSKDLESDEMFAEQHEKFSWVNVSHLDIDLNKLSKQKRGDTTFIEYAITELNRINDYRAPRDKIICILNACKIIFGFLKVSNQETNADAFIPLLIMVIIKAKTDHLISNLHYIESYRGEEWLTKGETSYYLSSLQAAVTFILNLRKEELTINQEEYDAHMEAWEAEKVQRQLLNQERLKLQQPQPQHNAPVVAHNTHQDNLSPSNVLLTSAEMFTKSISNFLSPSPHETEPSVIEEQPDAAPVEIDNSQLIKQTYENLREIFPVLDEGLLKDMIIMNKGDFDESLQQCLQIMNEV